MNVEPEAPRRNRRVFSVTGEYVTRIAREACLDSRPESGARILREGFDMSWDQAFSILKGESRLEGDSKVGEGFIQMVPDSLENSETAEYVQDLLEIYAGRVRSGGKWYRPYAYVTGFGRKDMEYAFNGVVPINLRDEYAADLSRRRAKFYCEDQDLLHLLPVPASFTGEGYLSQIRWVLFERTDAPPVWLADRNGNPDEALRDWLSQGGSLQAKGPVKSFRPSVLEALDAPLVLEAHGEDEAQRERWASRRAEEDDREAKYQAKLVEYRAEVLEQADELGGYFKLVVKRPEGDTLPTVYKIPSAAFEVWSLWRTNLRHLAPEWKTVCESGLKMSNDDPTHTDWMLGAEPTIPLDTWYDDKPLMFAAIEAQGQVQKRKGDFQVTVMCGTGVAYGAVLHPDVDEEVPAGSIIVIPHAGPDYGIPAMSAGPTGAIITEHGGELSHLSVLGIDLGLRMVRIPDALKSYPVGTDVKVDCDRGRVRTEARDVRGLLGEYK